MDMFVIRGGRALQGSVGVSGAKNAALPIMATTLALAGPTRLNNVPTLVDVRTLAELLTTLGVHVARNEDGSLDLETRTNSPCVADYDLVRRMRASICVLGPLLACRGFACVSLPGGCNIGDRPIDLHLKGLHALGADIRVERGYVVAEASRLRGAHIFLGGPFGSTVTGTCNIMAAAALANGRTVIESAACEPEVADLGNFLNAAGAQIEGLGTPRLQIEGVDRLCGVEWTVIPDRIEAATLMLAAACTGGKITVNDVRAEQLTAVIEKLRELGIAITSDAHQITVDAPKRPAAGDCVAMSYPGIPTDTQAQLMALLVRARGMSIVTDNVFPDRFMHASELVRLGAVIRREGSSAIIQGVPQLSGASVMASDLRASAALVLAALGATGESVVRRIYHLDRGYEKFDAKLQSIGAEIERVADKTENMPVPLRLTDSHSIPAPKWKQTASGRKRQSPKSSAR